jgi:hypothetical protein
MSLGHQKQRIGLKLQVEDAASALFGFGRQAHGPIPIDRGEGFG